ncbi:MAG: tetratricopeptide repeat protein, partial [Candidatus Omnitrophica bacterium]|nr:tetratricopeptide repeat protein [Candidatus Omnitrophota bacterium]
MPTDLFFKFILVTILTLSTYVFSFAQDSRAARDNQGYVQTGSVSLTKKEAAVINKDDANDPLVDFLIEKKQLTEYQAQARGYRKEGLEAQNRGDLVKALDYYSKAAQYDPGYAVVFNDLGIVYEATDDSTRAEQSYLQAIKIDPNFLSPYSN